MLTAEPWKSEVHGQDFSQVASRVVVEIEPNEEKRTLLLARVTEAQSSDGSANIAEAKALVEVLDKVQITCENLSACSEAPTLSSRRQLTTMRCEAIVSVSCLKYVARMLSSRNRTSYPISRKRRSGKLAEPRTFGRGNWRKKTFASKFSGSTRPTNRKKSKGWVKFHLAERGNVVSLRILPGVLLSCNTVEIRFA